jgi:hypothetical protein
VSKSKPDSLSASNAINAPSTPTLPVVEAMTIREFGRRYSLCRASCYVEIREGRLTACKIGYKTVILREDADRWVRNLPRVTPRIPGAGRPPKYPAATDMGAAS